MYIEPVYVIKNGRNKTGVVYILKLFLETVFVLYDKVCSSLLHVILIS